MSELSMNERSANEAAVLSCRNLGKRYEQGPESVSVLSGLELELFPGQRVAIVGTSGSGKSTLLNLLGGLDTPSDGSVWLAAKASRRDGLLSGRLKLRVGRLPRYWKRAALSFMMRPFQVSRSGSCQSALALHCFRSHL